MKRRTMIVTALAGAAMLALLTWAFAPSPVAVELAAVSLGRFEQAIVEDGRTRLRERYSVNAPLAGRLARITLREGDAVAEGAALALITPVLAPLLDERSRAELVGRRDAAQAGVQRAAVLIEQQRTLLAQARNELQRSEQLAGQGFVSPTKLDADRLALQAAQQALEAAQQTRHMAEHELEVARAALQAQQSGASAGFLLRSPVAGRVLKVAQASETTVALGTALLEIGDTAQLEIVAELLTTDAMQAKPGAAVLIDRWGGTGLLQGRLRSVEPAAFTKVSALGVEEQRVKVLIDLSSPVPPALGDGFRVGVRILSLVQDGAMMVPVSAVFPQPGQPGAMAVFVAESGRARLRAVTLGGRNNSQAWVRSGLSAGQAVIEYPPAAVAEGVRIKSRQVPGS
jgi:HlyD family secretion protein